MSLPIPERSSVFIGAAGLARDRVSDHEFVRRAIELELAREGFHLVRSKEGATYRLSVLIQTVGMEQGVVFLGMSPIQSVLISFALPELFLYKDLHQTLNGRQVM